MNLLRLAPWLFAFAAALMPPAMAQSPAENLVRMEQLESRVRQLNGIVEQLQFRNQQLEQQLKRFQEDVEFRFQDLRGGTGTRPVPPRQEPPTVQPGRRSDAFDPLARPEAPGVPRTLGAPPAPLGQTPPSVGAPNGRASASQPLDLGSMAQNAVNDPALGGPGAVMAPAEAPPAMPAQMSSRQEYDIAYGHLLRQDYPTAENGFRDFLRKYPRDVMAANANFWLGESLFQRQRHVDAARSFLTVATDFPKAGKAPDAMLRLGQSLAAMGQKDEACATFAQVPVKYPKASATVKTSVERERKRAGC